MRASAVSGGVETEKVCEDCREREVPAGLSVVGATTGGDDGRAGRECAQCRMECTVANGGEERDGAGAMNAGKSRGHDSAVLQYQSPSVSI